MSRSDTPKTPALDFPYRAALEALAVVSSYGDVIVGACKESGAATVASQSLLPYPRETIKKAILYWLSLLMRRDFDYGLKGLRNLAPANLGGIPLHIPEDFDKETFSQSLVVGYLQLGSFTTDEDARIVRAHVRAMDSAVAAGGVFLSSDEEEKGFTRVLNATTEAVRELNAELDRFHREPWQVEWP